MKILKIYIQFLFLSKKYTKSDFLLLCNIGKYNNFNTISRTHFDNIWELAQFQKSLTSNTTHYSKNASVLGLALLL